MHSGETIDVVGRFKKLKHEDTSIGYNIIVFFSGAVSNPTIGTDKNSFQNGLCWSVETGMIEDGPNAWIHQIYKYNQILSVAYRDGIVRCIPISQIVEITYNMI